MAGCKILFTTAFRPDIPDALMLAVMSCFVVISAVTSGDQVTKEVQGVRESDRDRAVVSPAERGRECGRVESHT